MGRTYDSVSEHKSPEGLELEVLALEDLARERAEWRLTGWVGGFVWLGGLAWGLDLGSISGALAGVRKEFGLGVQETGVFVGLMSLGELLGSTVAGLMGDAFGRVVTIGWADAWFLISAVLLGLAQSKAVLFAGRFASGIAVGTSYVAQVAWASEVAPPAHRGTATACYELAISCGFLASFAVFSELTTSAWRILFILPAAPAFMQLVLLRFCPESPRWLASSGRPEDAQALAKKIYGRLGAKAPRVDVPVVGQGQLWAWRLPWAVVVVVGFLTFFTGGFNLRIFVPELLEAQGLSEEARANVVVGLGLVKLVATAVGLVMVDTVGRKPMLASSLVVTIICALLVAAAFATDVHHAVVIVAALIYTAAFQLGFGMCNFILVGELFPYDLKGRLMSSVKFPAALFQFVSQYFFALALGRHRVALLFFGHAAVAFLGFLFVVFVLVESKSKAADEIRDRLYTTPAARLVTKCFLLCAKRAPVPLDSFDDDVSSPSTTTPKTSAPPSRLELVSRTRRRVVPPACTIDIDIVVDDRKEDDDDRKEDDDTRQAVDAAEQPQQEQQNDKGLV